jgi:hypothetical protein
VRMSQLAEILKEIEDKRAESRIIPEDSDPRVRAGVEALVRNAKAEVAGLEAKYKDAVMQSVVLIGLQGPNEKDFADIAQEKFKAMAIDFKLLKANLLSTLASRNAGATYNTNVHFMVLDELTRIRTKYDVVRLPTPMISGYNDGIYDAPLSQAIDILFEKNYGPGLYSAVTRREIGIRALENGFQGSLLPVIVYNFDGRVDTTFLPNPVMTISASEKATIKNVKSALEEVKEVVMSKVSNKNRSDRPQTGGQDE